MTTHAAGVLDTSIIAALRLYDPAELPGTFLITAVTLRELSYGPHVTDDPLRRAARTAVLQHVEATFDRFPTITPRPGSTGRYVRRSAPRDASPAPAPLT